MNSRRWRMLAIGCGVVGAVGMVAMLDLRAHGVHYLVGVPTLALFWIPWMAALGCDLASAPRNRAAWLFYAFGAVGIVAMVVVLAFWKTG